MDESFKYIHKKILDYRKIRCKRITNTTKITNDRIGHIVREYLGMLRLFAKWMPLELTIDWFTVSQINENEQNYFRLLSHSSYTSHPQRLFLSSDLQKIVEIADTETYLEEKCQSYFKNYIETLEGRCIYCRCIGL